MPCAAARRPRAASGSPPFGMQAPVHLEEPGLGVGIGHAPRQLHAFLQAVRCLVPSPRRNAISARTRSASTSTRHMSSGRARAIACPTASAARSAWPSSSCANASAGRSSVTSHSRRPGRSSSGTSHALAASARPSRMSSSASTPDARRGPADSRFIRPARLPPGPRRSRPRMRPLPGTGRPERSAGRASTTTDRLGDSTPVPGPGRRVRSAAPRLGSIRFR